MNSPAPHDGQVETAGRASTKVNPAVNPDRPFGAHLQMSWWKPLVLIVALPLTLVIFQVAATLLAGIVEGSDDPFDTEFTPLKSMAINLSIGLTGVVAMLLLVWMTRVPWRVLFSPRRRFDRRRLAHYSLTAVLLVGAGMGAVAVIAPESTGWTDYAISSTTIALLIVTVLTTPIQSVGEELMYRSAMLPAAASWIRAVRPALAVGLVVSALGFALVHGSTDPWLLTYFLVVALSTGLMAIISGGMEAPIAFHVVNNVLAGVLGNVMSDGGTSTIDRTTATGDASLLLLVAANIAMVACIWVYERRCREPEDLPDLDR